MEQYTVKQIGRVSTDDEGFSIVLDKAYAPALKGLSGFSHLALLWWFDQCDDEVSRQTLQEASPYRQGPETLGTFATRSPSRPNPIALSCVAVTYVNEETATIGIAYTDADPGSPVLDLKPYTPSLDRVETPATPDWCAHWPKSLEESGSYDWSQEFNF